MPHPHWLGRPRRNEASILANLVTRGKPSNASRRVLEDAPQPGSKAGALIGVDIGAPMPQGSALSHPGLAPEHGTMRVRTRPSQVAVKMLFSPMGCIVNRTDRTQRAEAA